MVIKLAWEPGGGHYRVRVFTGADGDHLALAGVLTLRPAEAIRFRYTIRGGLHDYGFTGVFESGWDREKHPGDAAGR